MDRLTARMRFSEGLPAELATKVVTQFHNEHPERYLLAYAYGYLGEQDLLKVRTNPEKSLLLAVLNLVECIAHVGANATILNASCPSAGTPVFHSKRPRRLLLQRSKRVREIALDGRSFVESGRQEHRS